MWAISTFFWDDPINQFISWPAFPGVIISGSLYLEHVVEYIERFQKNALTSAENSLALFVISGL